MGRIKFIFPNPDFVFMHDTPETAFFDLEHRDVSAGCIRIEHPFELAAHLLRLDGRPVDRADRILASGRTDRIHFRKPVPMILIYATVVVDGDGQVVFRNDVYDRDARVLAALNHPANA